MDGLFPPMGGLWRRCGAGERPFDGGHVLIPPLAKGQLEELAGKLG